LLLYNYCCFYAKNDRKTSWIRVKPAAFTRIKGTGNLSLAGYRDYS
jgi:hypothetical protein